MELTISQFVHKLNPLDMDASWQRYWVYNVFAAKIAITNVITGIQYGRITITFDR